MTWPTHGAGPTTPEPEGDEPQGGPPRRAERRRDRPWPEPPWNEPPRNEEPRSEEPRAAEPGQAEPETLSLEASPGRRGRHSAPDPLPPLEGPMFGGGPTPAETTLPLALSWPAPPTRGPRPPRMVPPGPAEGPGGWRRVPRPDEPPVPVQPRHQPSGYRPPGAADQYREPAPRGPVRPSGGPVGPSGPRGPGGPGGPAQPGRRRARPAGEATSASPRSSLVRSGAGMAIGTLVSRGTGFLRTLVLAIGMGLGPLGVAYNNANTLPNTVYYLMLGGIFTAVVVPLLVRAAKRDPDRGEAYTQRLFTLGAVALLVITIVATLAAGPLVDLPAGTINGPPGSHLAAEHQLMVVWARFFIPQIFFYGMSSLIGAILNTRGRFAAPMWTPVINNLIVIVVGGLYVVTVGGTKQPWTIPSSEVELLGIGTTLGVIAQTVALFPSLRGAGFRWKPTLSFQRAEVSEIGRMARWMLVYVTSQTAGNLIAQRVANTASSGENGYAAYSIAWQLFQLPYAIVGISVITALLPRMSEHASARRYSLVRDDFSTGIRLAAVIVVPAAIYLGLLGGPLAEVLFAYRTTDAAQARYVGETFGLFSLGLVPYLITQLQLRVFYSFQDSRTAAFVGVLIMCVSIVAAYITLAVLPHPNVVAGLGVAYGSANLVGAIAGWALLCRRVGSLDGWAIARSLARMHLATVPGLIFAWVVMIGVGHLVHNPSVVYGLVVIVFGGGGAVVLYAVCARALRIAEFGYLTTMMAAKFGRQRGRH